MQQHETKTKTYAKMYSIFTDGSGSEVNVYYVLRSPGNLKKLQALGDFLNGITIPEDDTQYSVDSDVKLSEGVVDALVQFADFPGHGGSAAATVSHYKLDRELKDLVLPDQETVSEGMDDLFVDL